MAGSIADNSVLYRKKTFTYVPPTPPAELIESTSYTLDFASRKFVHIGFDPSEKLQVVVHLLTSSRYVHITTDFMKKIFGFMGHILSFILDTPQEYKRVIFYEDEKMKLSSMMYSGENVLVIEKKNRDGCRVLLNRGDLLRLQYLECSIFESIMRKEVYLNSEVFPYEDFQSDFTRNKLATLYRAYVEFQKSYYGHDEVTPLLNRTDFKNLCPIIVVDMSKQNDNVKMSTVDLRIELEADEAFPASTSAYCLILHDQIITYNPFNGEVRTL
ncbi:hypothetical protein AGLY_007361 [Aphis glycines]|uniref:Double jelly roll-like domain-containing protein n=1 Tax=Aphis glycines TaxID=307491 RepID=A0A6G0TQP6_APHGL|nr:hypothetical protein AGLY_007361 [Aphis glycines]